jgi:hypothetical protein
MKQIKNYLLILICSITIVFCNEKNDKTNSINQKKNLDVQTTEKTKILLDKSPINLNEIKNKFDEYTTSTILSNAETKIYYIPDTIGYFGSYHLIGNKEGKYKIVGILTVFNNEKIWTYDNKSDIFIEIVLYDKDVLVYNNIDIGEDEAILLKELGNPHKKIKNHYIYVENNQTIAVFEIIDKKIAWIKIGCYKDDIISNIDKYIYELINHYNFN